MNIELGYGQANRLATTVCVEHLNHPVVFADVDQAIGDGWRRSQSGLRADSDSAPQEVARCFSTTVRVEGVQQSITRAEIDDAVGNCGRRGDEVSGRSRP